MLNLPALVSVDFSDNAFGGRSAEPMCVSSLDRSLLCPWLTAFSTRRLEFISSHPTLEVFKLNNNGMGPAGGAMIAGALLKNAHKAKAAGRKPTLRTIICGEPFVTVHLGLSTHTCCRHRP